MRALMLAAGLGRRLYGDDNYEPPKAMLQFDGVTLLQRHIEILHHLGVEQLTLIVGHRKDDLMAEAQRVAADGFVEFTVNPRYREGPILSLAKGEPVLRSGEDVLFMDSDVLYQPSLLERLIRSPNENCFVMDSEFQSTDDFVKVCLRDGQVVDFGKQIGDAHDTVGEWPGFAKFSPRIAARLADATQALIDADDLECAYEKAFHAVLTSEPVGTFGFEDITGTPWIEIDSETDLEKAQTTVFPRIAGSLRAGEERALQKTASV